MAPIKVLVPLLFCLTLAASGAALPDETTLLQVEKKVKSRVDREGSGVDSPMDYEDEAEEREAEEADDESEEEDEDNHQAEGLVFVGYAGEGANDAEDWSSRNTLKEYLGKEKFAALKKKNQDAAQTLKQHLGDEAYEALKAKDNTLEEREQMRVGGKPGYEVGDMLDNQLNFMMMQLVHGKAIQDIMAKQASNKTFQDLLTKQFPEALPGTLPGTSVPTSLNKQVLSDQQKSTRCRTDVGDGSKRFVTCQYEMSTDNHEYNCELVRGAWLMAMGAYDQQLGGMPEAKLGNKVDVDCEGCWSGALPDCFKVKSDEDAMYVLAANLEPGDYPQIQDFWKGVHWDGPKPW